MLKKILKIVQSWFWLIWFSLLALTYFLSMPDSHLESYLNLLGLITIGGSLSFSQWSSRKKTKVLNNLNIIYSFFWFLLYFSICFRNIKSLEVGPGMKAYYILVAVGVFPVLFHMIVSRYLKEQKNAWMKQLNSNRISIN